MFSIFQQFSYSLPIDVFSFNAFNPEWEGDQIS